jgi:hypothetical protein
MLVITASKSTPATHTNRRGEPACQKASHAQQYGMIKTPGMDMLFT